jgi:hypothetical protein
MSCSGSHLGITINIKNTKFVKDLPMIDAHFRFNQCNSFREEYISLISPYGPVVSSYYTDVCEILRIPCKRKSDISHNEITYVGHCTNGITIKSILVPF